MACTLEVLQRGGHEYLTDIVQVSDRTGSGFAILPRGGEGFACNKNGPNGPVASAKTPKSANLYYRIEVSNIL